MTESLSIPALLKSEAGQAFLAGLESLDRFPKRVAVARAVCVGLGLADARGRLRISSCIAALATLEAATGLWNLGEASFGPAILLLGW